MERVLKIFIAEDDVFISEQLNDILLELGHEVTGIGFNYASSIASLEQQKPDIAILDIKMHGEDQGLEIAAYIRKELRIPFLFLTSFSDQETVRNAGQYQPEAYIVKPFNKKDIYSNLSIVMMRTQSKDALVVLKDGREKVLIKPEDILWIKADDKYLEIFTEKKKYVERTTIKEFLEKYPTDFLIRCHKSFVINLHSITAFSSSSVRIKNELIPVGRKYSHNLKERLP